MNNFKHWIILVGIIVVAWTGCGGKSTVDTKRLERDFATAEPAIKSRVDAASAAIKADDYGTAVVELSRIDNSEKLTPQQQSSLRAALAQSQKIVAASAPKNVDKLPMALPK